MRDLWELMWGDDAADHILFLFLLLPALVLLFTGMAITFVVLGSVVVGALS